MIRLRNARIIDPANTRDEIGEIWIKDGRIAKPGTARETIDLGGRIAMAGAIDIHTHVAGGNVNTARLMLPGHHKAHAARPGLTALAAAGWSTGETGRLYAQMGFTTVVEPAMLPANALHSHLEMADIPLVDKAGLCVLGNDDAFLALLRDKAGAEAIRDYVAYMLAQSKALGIKVINAGANMAFKANARSFNLDDVVPRYGVTSRDIVLALQRAVSELGIPHPLHVHCNNLGDPGNAETAIATMAAADGLPIHFAHMQFYGYGSEGKRGFSSAARRIADEVNRRKNVTIDIGQVMFGQTVTVSCDVMRQFTARDQGRPRKWAIYEGEGSGGGIVPYTYSAKNFYNAVQWAVGLELFLLIDDPMRVFFTTDHPNGAPFITYPQIFAFLMDRDVRARWMAELPKSAMAVTTLPDIAREYSLYEVATMTRAAPARLLGLGDRGHLGEGAVADISVYTERADRARMFSAADYVFKSGKLIVKDGAVVERHQGRALMLEARPERAMKARMARYYEETYGLDAALFDVQAGAIGVTEPFEAVPW